MPISLPYRRCEQSALLAAAAPEDYSALPAAAGSGAQIARLADYGSRCTEIARRHIRSSSRERTSKAHRPFQHRVEHRLKFAGRGVDDLQYLGGCGLLFQGLARLGDERAFS